MLYAEIFCIGHGSLKTKINWVVVSLSSHYATWVIESPLFEFNNYLVCVCDRRITEYPELQGDPPGSQSPTPGCMLEHSNPDHVWEHWPNVPSTPSGLVLWPLPWAACFSYLLVKILFLILILMQLCAVLSGLFLWSCAPASHPQSVHIQGCPVPGTESGTCSSLISYSWRLYSSLIC